MKAMYDSGRLNTGIGQNPLLNLQQWQEWESLPKDQQKTDVCYVNENRNNQIYGLESNVFDILSQGAIGGIQANVASHLVFNPLDSGKIGIQGYPESRLYIMRFIHPGLVIVNVGSTQELNRYSYVNNNLTNLIDPIGHFINPVDPIVSILSTIRAISTTIYLYDEGERNILKLASAATGFTDIIYDMHKNIDSLNADSDIVFSNDNSISEGERWRACIHVGTFAVGTAANIVGGVQIARGALAFSRGGVGSLDYAVEGTKFKDTFVKGDQLFRVSGGETFQEGNWSFTQNPGNQINAIRKGALPPGNLAQYISKLNINGLVDGEVSQINGMFGQPGGAWQVYILRENPLLSWDVAKPLPLGFMPFLPPWGIGGK
jgi:hypothetical protein